MFIVAALAAFTTGGTLYACLRSDRTRQIANRRARIIRRARLGSN